MSRLVDHSHRLCIAPMLHCTDRHFRYLARLLTKHSVLYTEMITTRALIHGNRQRLLKIHPCEHPVSLQLGGSSVAEMRRCAEYATEYGYDEININVGCPSNRVQAGKFGACLMLEPHVVANCIRAIKAVTHIEATVKTRIGVDNRDSYQNLHHFVETIASAGCSTFFVHARKAFLSGLSPRENRTVPPLRYEYVYRLKQDFPDLRIVLNGGLNSKPAILSQLEHVDGVMIGREAYENPYFLADVDTMLFNSATPSRHEVLKEYKRYMQQQLDEGVPLRAMTRHILGLFNGISGTKAWKRYLSEYASKKCTDLEVVCKAESLLAGSCETNLAA